jgi:hypothetical protein
VRNLVREGIEVTVAREGFRSQSAHDYTGTKPAAKDFPAGTYVIDLNQPQKRLAMAHLEPNPELDKDFIKRELERRERNERRGKNVEKEGYEFYDITSWSLPLAFGVEAYWTEDVAPVRGAEVVLGQSAVPLHRMNALSLAELSASDSQPLPGLAGAVEGGRATSAYIIPNGTDSASRLTIALLAEGFKLAVATRQLNAGGRNWPAGTLMARVHRNPETLHSRISELARETGAQVFAANSAFSDAGDTGVGSESVVSLKQPRVLVVWDAGVSVSSYGAMWYTFERAYGLKFTPVSMNTLKGLDLSDFNVIILPDGSAAAYQNALGKPGIDKLKEWVQGGGALIGIGGGAALFTRKDVEMTSSRPVGSDEASKPDAKPEEKSDEKSEAKPEAKPAEKKKPTEPVSVPGAAFRAKINRDHFLSYGYDSDSLVVLFSGDTFFSPSKDGANVVTFNADGPLTVSGFVWPNNTEELLKGTSYIIDEPSGGGHVIMFAEDPNFRYLWRSATQFLLNSILLAPTL